MVIFIFLVMFLSSFIIEFMWIEVVYKWFLILLEDEEIRKGNSILLMGEY